MGKIWQVKVRIILTVIWALGTISKALNPNLAEIDVDIDIGHVRKRVKFLLRSVRVLKKVFGLEVACWNLVLR